MQEMVQNKVVIVDETIMFHNKRWKKPREAFVFLVKHQRELPMLLRVALVLAYKKLRGQKISVPSILKDFRELQRYKDEIYNFIALEDSNDELVALLKRIKLQGTKIIFTISMMKESVDYNKQLHKEIFDLFDEIILTAAIKKNKKEVAYYKAVYALVTTKMHDNNPSILVIDSKKEHVTAANQVTATMQGCLFDSIENIENYLVEKNYVKGSV